MHSWRPEIGNKEEGRNCVVLPEEKLVDYAMNRLGEAERLRVAAHAAQCPHCAERLNEWESLMAVPEMQALSLREQGNAPEDEACMVKSDKMIARTVQPDFGPPARLGRKLRLLALLRSFRIRLKLKRRFILPGAAGLALMICLFAGLFTLKHQANPSDASIERQVTSKIAYMQSADYEKYPIAPLPPLHGSGGLWINPDSGELLIVMDGLNPSEEKDYQVWLQHEQQSFSAGMMLTRNLQGKGYYYGYGIMNPDRIVISLEPKGGSLVQTGPETVRIKLNKQP
ncbi:anti-sigma factor [Paenibacillus sp. VCA1]|uniref:anti-sigma factor domain-containing protein n=1 Tax=Paenibacillus sp. VCA1 TaxID=3039148 RepID=UPI002872329D|nr:anti-sigma factor [Paenibacillus sp. VCA1]MDR9855348.1 anti-sigma factor [Paenibacillus sp. VCA1]